MKRLFRGLLETSLGIAAIAALFFGAWVILFSVGFAVEYVLFLSQGRIPEFWEQHRRVEAIEYLNVGTFIFFGGAFLFGVANFVRALGNSLLTLFERLD